MGLSPHALITGRRCEGDVFSGFSHTINRTGYREGASRV
ncbi:hypothetical protein FBBNIHIM_19280 [Pseudocitrobacter vendiensis]|uniref:Uncharacterized protein n=1 Tax=Pseudocitrobacter vendiensis TaxID=2488306 RepID=A0ABM9FDG0_9ENTR|nr:hypothetical protein FBBNIHIM_19280 [Pseudocitrobacter vendiensis]